VTYGRDPKHPEPRVVRTEGTCGGRARIDGTRIPVWLVVSFIVRGEKTREEFLEAYPHITLPQVEAALAYYSDHREEVDGDLRFQDAAWDEARAIHGEEMRRIGDELARRRAEKG
jgi:uncharacterized protein (DUF433 family)